ncbi:MAG TPA: rRNA maturation RNase YbeY [Candidatus Paceibacterota bacterium]|nr:rRNA maturation RNase YbeY [Candidatus Paceibacterota bacterium]
MLDLVFKNETPHGQWTADFFSPILAHTLDLLQISGQKVEVGLYVISPERSRELNREHRGKDRPTDVLSFPINDTTLKKYDILPLGDVFICADVARRQAAELNIPLRQEMARLAVHGLLHLAGHDHERSPEDERTMIDLQERILSELSISP